MASMCLRAFMMFCLVANAPATWAQTETERQSGDVALEAGGYESRGTTYEVERGTLWVPANRNRADSELIALTFIRFATTATEPAAPIVYLAGGPGGSGIAALSSDRGRLFLELLDTAEFIAFDQRGTGNSEPRDLSCDSPLSLPFDAPGDDEVFVAAFRERARACAEDAIARGVDLEGLTTEESADDLDALRRALGVKKLTLWGSSYGTHLALATVRRHPEAVERIILAGTEGPDHTYKLPSNVQTNLERLAALAREDSVYAELMPDLVGTLAEVLDRLEREPVTVSVMPGTDIVVGAWDVQRALSAPMGNRSTLTTLPAAIYAMSHGEFFDVARSALAFRTSARVFTMGLAMDCASYATPERLARIAREAEETVLGGAIDSPHPGVCDAPVWPRLGNDFRAPLLSDVPALFVSGTLDGRTPVSNAEEIAEGFTNHAHLVIEGASHGGDLFTSVPEIEEVVRRFVRGERIESRRIEGPAWSFTPPFQRSLEREMLAAVLRGGFEEAAARYRSLHDTYAGGYVYVFEEQTLNTLGYDLLRRGMTKPAVDLFRVNTVAYPDAFNTWDSLGEGYLAAGDTTEAVRSYEKSLALNPENANAERVLAELR